jgi:hypothetical protein
MPVPATYPADAEEALDVTVRPDARFSTMTGIGLGAAGIVARGGVRHLATPLPHFAALPETIAFPVRDCHVGRGWADRKWNTVARSPRHRGIALSHGDAR